MASLGIHIVDSVELGFGLGLHHFCPARKGICLQPAITHQATARLGGRLVGRLVG